MSDRVLVTVYPIDRLPTFGCIFTLLFVAILLGAGHTRASTVYIDEHPLYNPADPYDAIQAAVNNVATDRIVFRDIGSPWVLRKQVSIRNRSDLELVFEPGVEAQALRGSFKDQAGNLFAVFDSTNISFTGYGASIRMWKEDYQNPDLYNPSEFRHALSFRGGHDVTVRGLTIHDSGGDGIYIGPGFDGRASSNVVIEDVLLDNNHRQGMSVTSVDGLTVNQTVIRNTGGTSPQAGIDFEPDGATEQLTNITIRNSMIMNNAGAGIQVFLANLTDESKPVDIVVDNVTIAGGRSGILVADYGLGGIRGRTGAVTFQNGAIIGTDGPGIQISDRSSEDKVAVTIQDYRLVDAAANPDSADRALGLNNPIVVHADKPSATPSIGNVTLKNVSIEDAKPRSYLLATSQAQQKGVGKISGDLTIINPYVAGHAATLGANFHDIHLQTSPSTNTTVLRFDFERPEDSPSTGYIHVDENTLYSPQQGYGIVNESAERFSRRRSTALTNDSRVLDFVSLGNKNSQFVVDLPNGLYMITLVAGDPAFNSTERFEIEGTVYGFDGVVSPDDAPLFLLQNDGDTFNTLPIPLDRGAGFGQVSLVGGGELPEFLFLDRALIYLTDGQLNIASTGTNNGFHLNYLEIIPVPYTVPEPDTASTAAIITALLLLVRRRSSSFAL